MARAASVTARVTVAVPDRLVPGESVSVRLVPVPASTRLPAGKRFVSEPVTATVNWSGGVVSSATVKRTTKTVSSAVD